MGTECSLSRASDWPCPRKVTFTAEERGNMAIKRHLQRNSERIGDTLRGLKIFL